ncbi:hypothetical protein HaLaN_07372 [Haematococcus lacustris]|uniref:Uncharacterized protein n=1 Tax=Haematococcus lacustris TaxID=44745 RepID=A0A699YQE7_HAELA|nr:hypothetical protein HaLaN_07372 [Haematococcus lacustris]
MGIVGGLGGCDGPCCCAATATACEAEVALLGKAEQAALGRLGAAPAAAWLAATGEHRPGELACPALPVRLHEGQDAARAKRVWAVRACGTGQRGKGGVATLPATPMILVRVDSSSWARGGGGVRAEAVGLHQAKLSQGEGWGGPWPKQGQGGL